MNYAEQLCRSDKCIHITIPEMNFGIVFIPSELLKWHKEATQLDKYSRTKRAIHNTGR